MVQGPLQKVEFSAEEERLRFLLELEFVQTLANPNYLHCTPPALSSLCVVPAYSPDPHYRTRTRHTQ